LPQKNDGAVTGTGMKVGYPTILNMKIVLEKWVNYPIRLVYYINRTIMAKPLKNGDAKL
jgi:hypothetical protein